MRAARTRADTGSAIAAGAAVAVESTDVGLMERDALDVVRAITMALAMWRV